jgi:hypothetical protein
MISPSRKETPSPDLADYSDSFLEFKDPDPESLSLKLSINSGRAFLYSTDSSRIHLELKFFSQRLVSTTVDSCIDPVFGSSFIIPMPTVDLHTLSTISDPIHIVLIESSHDGKKTAIATASVDWRAVLYGGDMSMQVELKEGQVFHLLTPGHSRTSRSLYINVRWWKTCTANSRHD